MRVFIESSKLLLTPNELTLLELYTGGESLWINNFLRDRKMDEMTKLQKQLMKKYSINLNNLIRKSPPSKKNTTVYRGAEAMDEKWKNLKPGEELLFTQKGIISTTFNKNVAIDFIEEDSNCCLLVLRLPKGTRGLYISDISAFSDLEEDELLLPHGSMFKVIYKKINTFKDRKIITYYADLIHQ